jgi:hypothetical protein
VASVASLPHILPTAFVHVPTVHVRVSRVCLLVTGHQRPVGRFCNDLSRYDWWRPARRARGQALRLYTVYRHDTAGGIAWDRNGPTVARPFQGLDCGIPGWRGSSVDPTEMQLRIHTRPSTAIHKARSGGAACSVQHTASCRTLHACRRRVLIALVANV